MFPIFLKKQIADLYVFFIKFDIIIGVRLFFNRKSFDVILSGYQRSI